MTRILFQFSAIAIIAFIISFAFNLVYSNIYHSKIAVVHVNDIVEEYMQKYKNANLTEEEFSQTVSAFSYSLQQTIQKISDEKKVTLLLDSVVVSAVPDYTRYFKQSLEDIINEQ